MSSGFISTAANVMYITSIINHLLTSFSAVQIYDADLKSSTGITTHSSKREEKIAGIMLTQKSATLTQILTTHYGLVVISFPRSDLHVLNIPTLSDLCIL